MLFSYFLINIIVIYFLMWILIALHSKSAIKILLIQGFRIYTSINFLLLIILKLFGRTFYPSSWNSFCIQICRTRAPTLIYQNQGSVSFHWHERPFREIRSHNFIFGFFNVGNGVSIHSFIHCCLRKQLCYDQGRLARIQNFRGILQSRWTHKIDLFMYF